MEKFTGDTTTWRTNYETNKAQNIRCELKAIRTLYFLPLITRNKKNK